jgi:acyl-CoA dehydrogenase
MSNTATVGDRTEDFDEGAAITPEDFDAEVRLFLESRAPKRPETRFEWGEGSDNVSLFPELTPDEEVARLAVARAWRQDLFDAGLGWITGPPEFGGRGLPREYQRIYDAAAAEYQTPSLAVYAIGLGMVAPPSSPTPPHRCAMPT